MPELSLKRSIDASPERIWEALVDPELLDRWLTSKMENDVSVGGTYRDGNGDVGTYLVVDRPAHLRFTWDNPDHCPGTIVDVSIRSEGDRSELHLCHSALSSEDDRRHMRGGWDEALDLLKLLVESSSE